MKPVICVIPLEHNRRTCCIPADRQRRRKGRREGGREGGREGWTGAHLFLLSFPHISQTALSLQCVTFYILPLMGGEFRVFEKYVLPLPGCPVFLGLHPGIISTRNLPPHFNPIFTALYIKGQHFKKNWSCFHNVSHFFLYFLSLLR